MVIFRESNISNDRCWILDVEIVCLFLKVDTLWHLYYVYMLLHYNINHSQNIELLSWLQLFSSVTMTLDNPCVICNLTCSLIYIYLRLHCASMYFILKYVIFWKQLFIVMPTFLTMSPKPRLMSIRQLRIASHLGSTYNKYITNTGSVNKNRLAFV